MPQFPLFQSTTESDEFKYFEGEIFLTFYGEATSKHSLKIEDYARSLLGFNAAFSKLNYDLLQCSITVEIIAEEQGSLKAKLIISGKLAFYVFGAYASLLGILGYYKIENFPFNLFKKTIEYQKEHEGKLSEIENYIRSLNLSEKEKAKLIKLIKDSDFRKSLDELTQCLDNDGIDKIEMSQNGSSVSINTNERPFFKFQLEDTKNKEDFNDILIVASISRGDRWRFKSHVLQREIGVIICDEKFLIDINHYPVNKIFAMRFWAKVTKETTTRAGRRKPDPPVYYISDINIMPTQEELPFEE